MNELKTELKSSVKKVLAVVLIVALLVGLLPLLYTFFKDDYDKLSEKNSTYSVVIDENGEVKYIKTNEDGTTEEVTTEEMAEDFKNILKRYVDYDTEEEYNEKIEYLINAETVTKLPYIDSLESDDSRLNGKIKFYRYTTTIEADDAVKAEEEEENTLNPKELFYIGDSWMVGLDTYINSYVNDEYPGEDHFWCEIGLDARDSKFSNFNLKDRIDSVNSEVTAIVIMLGLNDTSEAAANRMNEIIDFLSTTYMDKTTYVLKVPHVGEAYEYGDIDANDLNSDIDEYNSIILKHCAEISNVNFIDVTSDMMTEDLYLDTKYVTSDGLHLNDTGKSVWYENIKECIGTGKSSSSTEKYRLTFIEREEFDQQMENYKSSGNSEIFKHFTMDEEGQVIIACGREEIRKITTEDSDITAEIVREVSGEASYSGSAATGFSMVRYTITEKPIDYLSLVEQYVMPSNLLYAFLITTENISFVEAIASLAYETDIEIGIYDNDSVSRSEETVTYIKRMDMISSTELNFDAVQTTNPVVNKSKLYTYNNIPYRCYARTSSKLHRLEYLKPGSTPTESSFADEVYITGVDNSNKITGLGAKTSAKLFTISYQKVVTSNEVSTYGVTLADTWIARWKATYKHENGTPSYSSNSGTYDDATIKEYTTTAETLGAFNSSQVSNISSRLDTHGKEMKATAVERIYNGTTFTPMRIADIGVAKRKDLLRLHINSCSSCKDIIESWWTGGLTYETAEKEEPTINEIYTGIINDEFEDTDVESHYWNRLQVYVNELNDNTKENFKDELKNSIKYGQSLTGVKKYENIQYTSSSTREYTKYEKDENIEPDKIGEKFSEVFNNGKFHNAKMFVIENIGWFWEYIEENEDTAKLKDVIKLLLNKATGSNDYGDVDEDEVLKAFEPKERMISASNSGVKLLREYIRYWENAALLNYVNGSGAYTDYVAKYINEEKTEYYIRDDGVGHPTVGFGIDIFNGGFAEDFYELGYTEAQLRDISGAVSVPVEFVDSLEEQEISEAMESIKTQTEGLELENYQIYALVSRAYNCGISGATGVRNGHDFVEAYTQYFNAETDLKYGETEGDFGHALYTNYMDSPTTSAGKVLEGLVRRRKSEWTLFQTGYMDTLERWASADGGIIECAEEIHLYMEENLYTYCVYFSNSLEECSSSSECGLNTTFEESKAGYHHTCCATFVSWVLQEAGYFEREDHTNGANSLKDKLVQKGWQEISSIDEAEPGDILWYGGHVDIYAGDGTKYNAGSGEAIRRDSPYKSSGVADAKMILRAP